MAEKAIALSRHHYSRVTSREFIQLSSGSTVLLLIGFRRRGAKKSSPCRTLTVLLNISLPIFGLVVISFLITRVEWEVDFHLKDLLRNWYTRPEKR